MPRQHRIVCVFKVSKSFERVARFIFNTCAPPRKVSVFAYFVFESLFFFLMTLSSQFPIAKSGCFENCSPFPTSVFSSCSLQVKILNQLSFFCTFSCQGVLDGLEKNLCAILSLLAFMWCCFLCYARLKKRKLFVISSSFSVTLNVPAELQLQFLGTFPSVMLCRLFLLYTALRCTKFVIKSLILREFLFHRKVFSCAAVCFSIYQVKLMKLLSLADFMR